MSSEDTNKKKAEQLGMPLGTASGRLKKNLLFKLIQLQELDICFQCGKKIENVDDLSIEHKVPWLDSDDPVGLFFDLNNISFSHLKCNSGAARITNKIISPDGYSWCKYCKNFKTLDKFPKKIFSCGGRMGCTDCNTKMTRKFRAKKN